MGDEIRVRKVSQEIRNNKMLLHKNLKGREEINLYEKVLLRDINTLDKKVTDGTMVYIK